MKPILEVRNIWKEYKIGGKQESYLSLRDSITSLLNEKPKNQEFWALEDVSFDVYEGECVGIIGRNGAGKSTLLKILSKITPPTKGYIKARGRVASLLEVGTGFHPELTGRENIYLNGSILGLKRLEITQKFDEIVEFSGVEKFLDTPLKHYSSGMKLRLAFSVAAHLEPEILLIDEVLAVGDAEFQKKCLGKMDEVSKGGRTVLFVSHDLGAIRQLCNRGLLLKDGTGIYFDNTQELLTEYSQSFSSFKNLNFNGTLKNHIKIEDVVINGNSVLKQEIFVEQIQPIEVKVHLEIKKELPDFRTAFSIFNDRCRIFTSCDPEPIFSPIGKIIVHYQIPSHFLRPAKYRIGIGGLISDEQSDWYWNDDICNFTITNIWDKSIDPINHGLVNFKTKIYRQNL